ncbi:hypothetical protein [Swaminathania salitolerans]|uniref:Outer membrane protease n=1 Tax=Swaminathania salitolerans TaxID=182838 RepID=A0A511BRK9_9PROT|nr:hypothetical protein [Swaminathania salitolerans]GBQ14176.1 hypothetical protein AA21291_1748 [Swaminathania salitolerans LMG 21291]GEL02940.1 hypothetical protein SSA02_21030 [Swaminathania salitolerans]
MRIHSALAVACLSTLSISGALADPLPVVAVNREIGLSMAGLFDNRVNGGSAIENTNATNYTPAYTARYHSRHRRIGWVPGFQVDASGMFTLGNVENIYAAAQFVLGSGSRNYKSNYTYTGSPYGNFSDEYGGGSGSHSTYTRGEIGKGFLVLQDRLLLTPFAQGGYITEDEYGYGDDGSSTFVGAGLKADYALTSRLVLRGRFGWAAQLERRFMFRGGVQSRWEGGLGLDYRMTRHFHLIGGGDYVYSDYGHGTTRYSYGGAYGGSGIESAGAYQNGLVLHTGLAYRY